MPRPPTWLVPFQAVALTGAQTHVDVGEDVPRWRVPCPAAVAPTVTTLPGLGDGTDCDAFPGAGGEHADHLVVVVRAAGPDHAVGTILLDPVDHPPAAHENFARHDYDALHRRHVHVFGRLTVHDLRPRVRVRGARRDGEGRDQRQQHWRSHRWLLYRACFAS